MAHWRHPRCDENIAMLRRVTLAVALWTTSPLVSLVVRVDENLGVCREHVYQFLCCPDSRPGGAPQMVRSQGNGTSLSTCSRYRHQS
jgi:hypothetical protein